MRAQTDGIIRLVGVAAAGLTALLYGLIGFQVLPIGQAAAGGDRRSSVDAQISTSRSRSFNDWSAM